MLRIGSEGLAGDENNYEVKHDVVGKLLEELGYSLRLNQKMLQIAETHPDRNTQFDYINNKAMEYLKAGIPVISIDAKKKEIVGNFKIMEKHIVKKRIQ